MLKKIGSLAILGFAVANLTGCWNLPVDPFPNDPPGDTLITDPPKPPCDTLRGPDFPPGDTTWGDPGFPPGDTTWGDPGFPPRDSSWVWDDTLDIGHHGGRGRR